MTVASFATLQSVLDTLVAGIHPGALAWQAGATIGALLLAWFATGALRRRFGHPGEDGQPVLAAAGFDRILFPLCGIALLLVAQSAVGRLHATGLMRLAVTLLAALAAVRFLVYLLRTILPAGSQVAAWERVIAWGVWGWIALHLSGLLPGITGFLDSLRIPFGRHPVSVLLIVNVALSVLATLIVALWLSRLVERRLMGAETLDVNLRVILAKLAKALLLLLALLFALDVVGVDLTLLSVFGGALGVGLAFGLQKIASNYVSGFIILADRSLSIGNTVTVDNREGVVTRMTARYIVVRNNDGTEALIPNETVITSTVVNQSYSDPRVRVAIPVQVSYDSDLDHAIEIMRRTAAAQPRVLTDPAPAVVIQRLADSGIDLELGVWIRDPEAARGPLRTRIYLELLRGFREHGIGIPYPQREVRLLSPAATARDRPMPQADSQPTDA
jgi:small-conductance mechanosensitive channel